MKRITPILLFLCATIFSLNGGIGVLHGDASRSILGLSQAAFWSIVGVGVKRRQKAT
jgi:hypothetical protein